MSHTEIKRQEIEQLEHEIESCDREVSSLVDYALQGQSTEIKYKIFELLIRSRIRPDDPLF